MRIIRIAPAATAAVLLALALGGCAGIDTGTGTNQSSGTEALPASCKSGTPTIAVLLPNLTNPYYVAMKKGFEDEAKAQGYSAKVQIANDDDANQLAQAQAALQDKPCALALNPVNSEPAAAIVRAANDAGVPVFNVNVGVSETAMKSQGAHIVQYLGADNVAGGKAMATQALKDLGGDAELSIGLVTAPDQTIVVSRDKGFKQEIASDSKAKVVATVDGKVQLDTALNVSSAMIQGNPSMNVIFASTGPATQGALQAVQASGRDIQVYGFCASELKLEGHYRACVAQEPEDYGKRVVEQIRDHVKGKKVPATVLRPLKQFVTGETPAAGEVG